MVLLANHTRMRNARVPIRRDRRIVATVERTPFGWRSSASNTSGRRHNLHRIRAFSGVRFGLGLGTRIVHLAIGLFADNVRPATGGDTLMARISKREIEELAAVHTAFVFGTEGSGQIAPV